MEYSIEIDASKGLVKAAGDKEFVESVIDRYESLMAAKVVIPTPKTSTSGPPPSAPAPASSNSASTSESVLDDYGSVFDVTDGKVSIIADIPGNTQAAKAKKVCLLYLFAKSKLGEDIVPNEEVREACKSHAVYDQTNFASQMKSQKKLVIANGPKGSPNFTLKLTVPGKKEAEVFAKDLENSS